MRRFIRPNQWFSDEIRRAGFTLVELLVVVGILTILAAIAIPNFRDALIRAKIARVKSDHRNLAAAIEAYATEHNTYPPYTATFYGSGNIMFGPNRIPLRRLSLGWIALTTPIAFVGSSIDNFVDPFAKPNTRYEDPLTLAWPLVGGRRISPPVPNRPIYYEAGFGSTFGATDFWINSAYIGTKPLNTRTAAPPPAREVRRAGYILTSVGPDLLDSMHEASWHFTRWVFNNPPPSEERTSTPHFWNYHAFLTYDPSNGIDSLGDIYRIGGKTPEWWGRFRFPLITP